MRTPCRGGKDTPANTALGLIPDTLPQEREKHLYPLVIAVFLC
ncbi:hypothetical protein DVDV_1049 [Desulfovibrio sp. DV]|nr:hypothetical protein DVDV_1049 [Desulfovibrio sp. DV]